MTTYGLRSFAEMENQPCRVLTDDGFKPALVKRFRRKPLVKLELAPAFEERDRYGGWRLTTRNISRFRRSVWATPTHSWILADGERTDSLDAGQFVPGDAARAEARRRELPARCAARARLRRRKLEQAGDPLGRAPSLRPALRRQGREVQGLLRSGQLLALPRRASRLRRHRSRARRRQPQALAARDRRHRVHRRLRRRLARSGRRSLSRQAPGGCARRITRRSPGSRLSRPTPGFVTVGSGEEGSRETNFGVRSRPIRWLYLATRETYWRVMSVERAGG